MTELPLPKCGENDVLLKNIYASICGTDVAVYKHGPETGHRVDIGGELGHEMVSIVYEVGKNVKDIHVGDRVYPFNKVLTKKAVELMNFQSLYKKWKSDYEFKTIISSTLSFLTTLIFALYNGFLGLKYGAAWNVSICVYYILLSIIRGIIINCEKEFISRSIDNRKHIHKIFSILLLTLNITLITPIALMTVNAKSVEMNMTSAIAVAAYTTYKIISASVNFKKSKRSDDMLVRDLKFISFIEALISVLTLQNTLLAVKGASSEPKMFRLSIITSTAGLAFIIFLTVMNLVRKCK